VRQTFSLVFHRHRANGKSDPNLDPGAAHTKFPVTNIQIQHSTWTTTAIDSFVFLSTSLKNIFILYGA
jgi:hypothetical protein